MGNQNNRIPLLPYAVNLRKRDREREGETGRERQGEGGRDREREGETGRGREGGREKGVDAVRNTISHCLYYE